MAQNDPAVDAVLALAGLGHLAPRFAAEDIDSAVLWSLTDADLRDIGLTLGQRKKLLQQLQSPTAPAAQPDLRRLTVLFCDLVGFTDLATRTDPDDLRAILHRYHATAQDAATAFGGFIASRQGDGIVMLFGFPTTQAGSADRAIRAAHALLSDLHRLPIPLAARIGIASGRAIVDDQGTTGAEPQMVGPVINRAARLQTLAAPGMVVVDDLTRTLAPPTLPFAALPDAALKGFDQKVRVAQSIAPGTTLPPSPAANNAPDSAHHREFHALITAWQHPTPTPTLALLTGEAGIGKSTLLAQITAQITPQAEHLPLTCTALSANIPLRPVIALLDGMLAATTTDRLTALQHLLPASPPDETQAIAALLGLATPPPQHPAQSPQQDRRLLLNALARFLTGHTPRLITVEDLHWADATTRDLLHLCAQTTHRQRVLILATSRDADDPLWHDMPHRLHLPLAPLDQTAAKAVLRHHLPRHTLPDQIVQTILTRSDGNPLMIEALARSADEWQDTAPDHAFAVPTSIYESLSARLEPLQQGRPLAAALAVFDEPTPLATLALALGVAPHSLAPAVAELQAAGIITGGIITTGIITGGILAETARANPPTADQTLQFRHNLYRAVCYERLVKSTRLALHRAAFAALDHLPRNRDTDTQRLQVLVSQAAICRARQGIAADEVRALGEQVLQLARSLGETRSELAALNGLYAHSLVRAQYPDAQNWAETLCETARTAQDQTYLMIGTRGLGVVAFHTGALATGASHLRAALAAYDTEKHGHLAHVHGYDHAEICAAFLSFTLWIMGDPAAAATTSAFSVSHAQDIGHMHSLAQALAFRAMLAAVAQDSTTSQTSAIAAADVARKHGLAAMLGTSGFFAQVAALHLRPEPPTAADLATLRARHDDFKQVNPYNYLALTGILMADLHLSGGDIAQAEADLAAANAVQTQTGEVFMHPELMRLEAKVQRAKGNPAAAQTTLLAAFDLATDMGATMFALRIACDLAETAPTPAIPAARHRLRTTRDSMTSTDTGWDFQRCASLLTGL